MPEHLAHLNVYCGWPLAELIQEKADAAELSISEYVAKAMAKFLRQPDLGKIPRKKRGRPNKAATKGGK